VLKGDALLAEQHPQALVADVIDHPLGHQEISQLGQAPGGNGKSCSAGLDLAIFLISRRCGSVNFGGCPPLYLGYSDPKPVDVEVADHIVDPVLAGKRDPRDRGHVHAGSSTIWAPRQVTTDPLPRRMIRTSRWPSSSSISRTRSRSVTGPVSGIGTLQASADPCPAGQTRPAAGTRTDAGPDGRICG
jgi:hypothetical protein